ncbi:hypothetical protein L9F63_003560, partial [Diploptera punctata]
IENVTNTVTESRYARELRSMRSAVKHAATVSVNEDRRLRAFYQKMKPVNSKASDVDLNEQG